MKKLVILMAISTMLVGLSVAAQATTYDETFLGTTTDSNYFTLYQGYQANFGFNLTAIGDTAILYNNFGWQVGSSKYPTTDAIGFVPGSTITSAVLTVTVSSNDSDREKVKITSGIHDGNAVLYQQDFTLGSDWVDAHKTITIDLLGANLGKYLSDGKFLASVFAVDFGGCTINDFDIDQVDLKVNTCSAPVPEPSTLFLLGAGIIGFGFLRRRSSK